jgi:hypothetical protein
MWRQVLGVFSRELVEFAMGNPSKVTENPSFQIERKFKLGWPLLNTLCHAH